MTATTIGFGDVVPRSPAFLLPTLLLVTLALALATVFVDQAAGLFKVPPPTSGPGPTADRLPWNLSASTTSASGFAT